MVRRDFDVDVVKRLSLAVPGIQLIDLYSHAHKVLCRSKGAATYRDAHGGYSGYNQNNKNQRSRPSLPVPLIIRRDGVIEYLQGQRGGGLVSVEIPELVAKSREQQRSRL